METKNYRKLALKASFFTLFGFGLAQVIRLANNMILTRLLVPEYFGIISIAYVFINGINLFSDIGLGTSVIRSNKTHEEKFINTVWTIQIIRGFLIAFAAFLIAFPVSMFYNEPSLKWIIIVIGSLAVIRGFSSMKLILYSKELKQGVLSVIELSGQFISSVIGISIAFYFRSVWVLVFTTIFGSVYRLICGYIFLKGDIKPRLVLDKKYIGEILHFGKWIFFSTSMTFLATQIDKIQLGKLLNFSMLGVFNIATMFSELTKQVLLQLAGKVIFPLFSQYKDLTRDDFRNKIKKPRRILLSLLAIIVILLAGFGDYLIILLYDPRYYAATWMLPILAIGMWPYILFVSNNSSLFVIGKPKYVAYGNIAKVIYMLIFIPISHHYWGLVGSIIAIAFNDIPTYIVVNYGLKKEKLSLIIDDMVISVILACIITLICFIRIKLNLGLPGFNYI